MSFQINPLGREVSTQLTERRSGDWRWDLRPRSDAYRRGLLTTTLDPRKDSYQPTPFDWQIAPRPPNAVWVQPYNVALLTPTVAAAVPDQRTIGRQLSDRPAVSVRFIPWAPTPNTALLFSLNPDDRIIGGQLTTRPTIGIYSTPWAPQRNAVLLDNPLVGVPFITPLWPIAPLQARIVWTPQRNTALLESAVPAVVVTAAPFIPQVWPIAPPRTQVAWVSQRNIVLLDTPVAVDTNSYQPTPFDWQIAPIVPRPFTWVRQRNTTLLESAPPVVVPQVEATRAPYFAPRIVAYQPNRSFIHTSLATLFSSPFVAPPSIEMPPGRQLTSRPLDTIGVNRSFVFSNIILSSIGRRKPRAGGGAARTTSLRWWDDLLARINKTPYEETVKDLPIINEIGDLVARIEAIKYEYGDGLGVLEAREQKLAIKQAQSGFYAQSLIRWRHVYIAYLRALEDEDEEDVAILLGTIM